MFTDRRQAGMRLAEKLASYKNTSALVVGLARGGVVVAQEVASKLFLPLDVLVVKKISSPHAAELAVGALAPDGVSLVNWRLVTATGVDERYIRTQIRQLADQIKQKTLLYRKGRKPLAVRDKTVILVDDGAATGATFEVAVKWAVAKKARKIVAAIPVTPPDTVARIVPEVSEVVTLETPEDFHSVGQFYRNFDQVEDEEVVQLLHA